MLVIATVVEVFHLEIVDTEITFSLQGDSSMIIFFSCVFSYCKMAVSFSCVRSFLSSENLHTKAPPAFLFFFPPASHLSISH